MYVSEASHSYETTVSNAAFTRQRVHCVAQMLELCANEIRDLCELSFDAPPLVHLGLGFNQLTHTDNWLTAHYWYSSVCLSVCLSLCLSDDDGD